MSQKSNWNAPSIYQIACELADIAVAEQQKLTTEIKPDNSIVTQADKLVEDTAIAALADPENNTFVIGEETIKELSQAELDQALAGNCYIIDPIDGTVPYASLVPLWGVSIGFACEGTISDGCIVLPGTYEAIITHNGQTLYGQGVGKLPRFEELQVVSPELKNNGDHPSRVLVINQLIAKTKTVEGLNRGVTTYYSVVFPYVYLALGRMAGICAGLNIWDAAAGSAILRNLGFDQRFIDGTLLSFQITQDYDFSKFKQGQARSKQMMIVSKDQPFSEELASCIK
ncbi:inositol monophosphatase family protein [Algibacillus agarilyticus]|uniref:inositol monophosphatase family protein n=1 Tax=Algibacillus agarilyticus TaxID=2234133 RepID=UPI00130053C2|nr:inositol monophosphatase family protein [Algibacillus agarilyticus]